MKTSLFILKTSVAVLALVACATVMQAQNRERFGISAKAGGVNAVTGRVGLRRDGKPPRLLTSQDDLESGDVVSTGVSGQIEVLLNPGTYLRMAERSEFVMEDTSLDNLLVRITKGSAIVEATGPGDVKLYIPIVTPQHRMTIVRPGVYRINVAEGTTELFVRKGRMALSDRKDDYVKGGKKVTFTSSGQDIAKLTDADTDQFDNWSKLRGQTLAQANARLSARMVNAYLSTNSWDFRNSNSPGWGLWTWSPFSNCYTFLPFRYGWGSPYGGYYGASFGYSGNSNNGNPYNPPVITSNGSSGSSGSGYPGGGTSGSGGSSGMGSSGGYGGGSVGGRSTTPTVTAPPTAGPRDPDSGGRAINAIKNPIN